MSESEIWQFENGRRRVCCATFGIRPFAERTERRVYLSKRFTYYARIRRRLRTLAADGAVAENTVAHNLKGMRDIAVVRSDSLVKPLSVLECTRR